MYAERPEINADINSLADIRKIVLIDDNKNNIRVLHHLERYEFIIKILEENKIDTKSLKILDIGCGLGFGLNILYNNFNNENMLGIDIDINIINIAKNKYKNINFINCHICNLGIIIKFDVIILFEILGEYSITNDEYILQKVDELLSDNGFIFISIPFYHRKEYKNKSFNRIYNLNSFTELVNNNFNNHEIKIFGQLYPKNRENIVDDNPILVDNLFNADFLIAMVKRM